MARDCQLWENDIELNTLLSERCKFAIGTRSYKDITKKVKNKVRWLKNQKLELEADALNTFANKRQIDELFRRLKLNNSTFLDTKKKHKCESSKLKEHFKRHFNIVEDLNEPLELSEAPEFVKELQRVDIKGINTNPPNFEEIRHTLKHLKSSKAANDIPAEYLKYAENSDEFIGEMDKLYRTIWITNSIPNSWGHSKLVTIWKGPAKGKLSDPATYRELQIGSTLCKIMMIIILNRIKSWYNSQLLDQQQGFRQGRGTTDGMYIIKRIQQITEKMKMPAFVLFVDLTAAFDHVIRPWLFKSIYQRLSGGSNHKLIKLLETLYSYTTTSFAETPDDLFELTLGVGQGGPESSPLFNLYIDYVMRVFIGLCEKNNIKFLTLRYRVPSAATTREERYQRTDVGEHDVNWSGYADDLALIFSNKDNLQNGLNTLDETFRRFHLTINETKTKTMILNCQHINQDISNYPATICFLPNICIENVTKFRYLGDMIVFNEPSTGDTEVELRIEMAENKFYELSKSFMNFNIRLPTRIKILNAVVRSRLTYSCQTWSITTRQRNRINTSYTEMLRKMVKGGYRRKSETEWNFQLTNNDLHNICKTEEINAFLLRQQKKYFAHLARQPNWALSKRLLFNDNKSRKPGPQTTLENMVLKAENSTSNDFYKKALNREI